METGLASEFTAKTQRTKEAKDGQRVSLLLGRSNRLDRRRQQAPALQT
jgi:hypothetical protein